jgi:sugar lactone lactonase YvrE
MATHFFGIRDRVYTYRDCIGRVAVNGEGFLCPVDLALAPNDVAYVVNRSFEYRPDGLRITKCTLGGEYLGEFGQGGEGEGEFMWPSAVAVDRDGNVYVADEWLNRIQVFDKDGKFLRLWGKAGSGDGELNGPAGLAFTSANDLFVVDSRNNRVQKFTADGHYLGKFGTAGNGPGQFNAPWGIGLDKDGNIYIADWRNDRIQKFAADGKWLACFGSSGKGAGQFSRPSGVCVDSEGDIYVADWQNDRVQVLTPEGRFVTAITGNAGLSKMGAKQLQANSDMIRQRALALVNDGGAWERALSRPTAVRADNKNRIAILDMGRYRIQLYEKSHNATLN